MKCGADAERDVGQWPSRWILQHSATRDLSAGIPYYMHGLSMSNNSDCTLCLASSRRSTSYNLATQDTPSGKPASFSTCLKRLIFRAAKLLERQQFRNKMSSDSTKSRKATQDDGSAPWRGHGPGVRIHGPAGSESAATNGHTATPRGKPKYGNR